MSNQLNDANDAPHTPETHPYGPNGPRKRDLVLAIRNGMREWAYREYLTDLDRAARGLPPRKLPKPFRPSKIAAFFRKLFKRNKP